MGEGGYPRSVLAGWDLGTPPAWDWGTPHLGLGYALRRNLGPVTGVPPRKDMGPVEVLWDGDGVPPPWVRTDTHPSDAGCKYSRQCHTKIDQQRRICQLISTFLHVAARYNA